jgi:uracil-DNA glycosylase
MISTTNSWAEFLKQEAQKDYYKKLWSKVEEAYEASLCFPPKAQIFRALELCPLAKTKVLILGQDPYHGLGQANGLAFSVLNEQKTPASLRHIFKELYDDLGLSRLHNDLEDWAKQGVLLLNATLSVEAHKANAHQDFGWQQLTDLMIEEVNLLPHGVVFVLWGAFAQKKEKLIDTSKHCVIKSAHPSPLSAYRGFFGSKVFSKIDTALALMEHESILWA